MFFNFFFEWFRIFYFLILKTYFAIAFQMNLMWIVDVCILSIEVCACYELHHTHNITFEKYKMRKFIEKKV